MRKFIFIFTICTAWLASTGSSFARPDLYLFYNSDSANLDEIDISNDEISKAFDDIFGPASDEIPQEVNIRDFYVAKFPDGSYVFTLKAPYNCAQLGCTSMVYTRDADGDLQPEDFSFPVKCKKYDPDKLLCLKGGYKVEKAAQPKPKGPVHYPAPRGTE